MVSNFFEMSNAQDYFMLRLLSLAVTNITTWSNNLECFLLCRIFDSHQLFVALLEHESTRQRLIGIVFEFTRKLENQNSHIKTKICEALG